MKQKHYYYFGEELTKKIDSNALDEKTWELIRNDENAGPFSLEKSVEKYEHNCIKHQSYREMAQIIIKELKDKERMNNKLVSCGSGKGILEWHLKKECPQLYITCTDYTKETIYELKNVFIDLDEAYTFDMINGEYSSLGIDPTIVMCRVSTEFDRTQWDRVFNKMYMSGIKFIIFIPTGLDTKKTMRRERLKHIINVVKGRKDIFCGWLYSEDEYLDLFKKNMYEVSCSVKIDDTVIYFLETSYEKSSIN